MDIGGDCLVEDSQDETGEVECCPDDTSEDECFPDETGEDDECCPDETSDNESSEEEDLEGQVPTLKCRKSFNRRALRLALESGRYPEYLGFEGACGQTDPSSNSALDYLLLLWPNSLCDLIVEETNRYARNRRSNWVDVDRDEVWTFLGIILWMGIHRLPRLSSPWSRDSLLGVPEIQRHMSMNRFWELWSNFHVVDNSKLSPGHGISRKLKPVLDLLSDTFLRNYSPGQELAVDEAMVKYKGHVKGKVRMPKKPIKEGFKIWCCSCSCCGYLCTFQLYEGKPTDPCTGKHVPEKGMVKRVVMDLVTPFSDMNHVLYMDNFFTSGPLVDALAKNMIYVAGTIQQRAAGFPDSLKGVKLDRGTYAAAMVGDTCYYVFHDRSVVSFVSNVFPEHMKAKVARTQVDGIFKYQSVPPVLPAYNKYMGAVDRLSQVRKTYGFDRKSKRFWVRLFFHFFDYAVNNAYLLYKHNSKHYHIVPEALLDFRLKLVRLMLRETKCRKRKRPVPSSDVAQSVGVCNLRRVAEIGLTRGRCLHCVRMKNMPLHHTTFGCSECRIRLCKTPCFAEFHQNF